MQQAGLERVDGFERQFLARAAPASLVVEDESLIPLEYIREKVASAPDKNAIKAALAAGVDVAGVRLAQRVSLGRK